MNITRAALTLRLFAAALALAASNASAAEYGTQFTYQGSLKASSIPVNTPVAMEFRIYDVAVAGVPLTGPLILPNVPVIDGVFSVNLDFGTVAQSTQERWLEVVVNSTILSPRQKLTPAPIAQATVRDGIVFGGQVHESPYFGGPTGTFASPNGITEALYSESRAQMMVGTACTARNLYVRNNSTSNYPSTTVTVRVNGVASALSCTQTNPALSCSNIASTVDLAAGDLLSVHFTPNMPARPITNSEDETRGFVAFGFTCD